MSEERSASHGGKEKPMGKIVRDGRPLLSRRDFVKLGSVSLAGAGLLGLTGCGGEETISGGSQEGGGSVFTYAQGLDVLSLDPPNQADDTSSAVASYIFDTLLQYPLEGAELAPWLAAEVPEPDDGGRSYTFALREGVEFHDGTPFNAEAVVFNFQRWRDTSNPYHKGGGSQSSDFSNYALLFGGFDDESVITDVRALDDVTVRFELSYPLGSFLANLAETSFAMASPEAIKRNVEEFWKNPVGTGPFRFDSWEIGSRLSLKKNASWWGASVPVSEGGGGPHLKKVVFQPIPDNTARVAALTGGNVTAADGIVPDDLPTIRDNPDLKVLYRPPLTSGYLAMNSQKEPFGDVRVRRAVAHAIDVPEIVESFFAETGEVASGPMSSGLSFFNEDLDPYGYDPAESRRLLEDAGFPDGFETDLWYIPIPRPYMPDGKGIAQAMQQDLKKVGIRAKLVTYEFATYLEKLGTGEHSMALYGGTDVGVDPDFRLNYWFNSAAATQTAATNVSFYENPEVDRLLLQARRSVDPDRRRDLYYRVQEKLQEDVPVVPLAYVRPPIGLQERVEGYTITYGGDRLNTVRL
jgi:peptide/nickel transport system substrate-binding protein